MSISKVNVSNTEYQIVGSPRYATCSTAAATAAKVASIADGSSTFMLENGVRICVKFTYANTVSTPTLNVASTGAKAIYWHGAALTSSQYWQAGAVVDFVYNGTQWELVGVAKDNNTVYSHPTTSGNKHIPSGGASGQILRWSADGTATWGADNNTTYSAVGTTGNPGLMSVADKVKLNGIAERANNYSLPTASSTLGGVKTTSTVTSTTGLTACPIISGVPYYKDTNTTYSLSSFGVTASATELNYTKGVTSAIQTQLNNKASSSHTHAYLPTAGGTMTGAVTTKGIKLTKNVDYGDTLPSSPVEGQLFFQTATNLVLDMVYPVGSIYMSVNATSPTTLFGGTWEAISGRFLIGTGLNEANTKARFGENDFPAGSINIPAGTMGGCTTHKLTTNEMPDHGHAVAVNGGTDSYGQTRTTIGSFAQKTSGYTDSSTVIHTGGNVSHNNMPPYLAVYMWKRTA